MHGPAEAAGASLAYAREGGVSFWTRTLSGYEEWLLLDAGIACPGAEVAAWDVEGGTLRQRDEVIDVEDASGTARLQVTAPEAYTASGRQVPVRLSVVGGRISIEVDAGCEAVLVDPAWEMTPPMLSARSDHAAVLLGDGTVLAIGGFASSGLAKKVAEAYEPATDMWLTRAPMLFARARHTATVLPSGKVVVTGGTTGVVPLESIEIYDPATNTWAMGTPMSEARQSHAAALLQNGNVLVAGGLGVGGPLMSAELYDPTTNAWTTVAPMSVPRFQHTATRMLDGRVLMWGAPGMDLFPNQNIPCDVYDPQTGTWLAPLLQQDTRQRHTATLLPDGRVLIAGGEIGGVTLQSAEVFDPSNNTRDFVTPPLAPRAGHTATLLPNGEVLITGGFDDIFLALNSTELFYSPVFRWTSWEPLNGPRHSHTATLLPDTRVVVVGGENSFVLSSAEIFGKALGETCIDAIECPSGTCIDGVCCNTACDAGDCEACSIAMGASQDGVCELLTGAPCEDGVLCTKEDTCQAGACVAGALLLCEPASVCQTASCDPATGTCLEMSVTDGSACPNGVCTSGECVEIPDAGMGGNGGAGGAGAGGGSSSAGGSAGAPIEYEEIYVQGGCVCGVTGRGGSGAAGWALGVLASLCLVRCKRRVFPFRKCHARR
jgi:hypothetical protein